jgi:hypothetical protein
MAGRNIVAKHECRSQIERDLALGVPVRRIVMKYEKFGEISKDALTRYRKKLPPQFRDQTLAQALRPEVDLEELKTVESEGLLASLAQQRARLLLMQDSCVEAEQFGAATNLSSQIHRNLELVGKYLGELGVHHTVTSVSVLVSPQYLELRSALLKALSPFPEAKRAVSRALQQIESKAAARPDVPALPAPEVVNVE